MILDLEVSEFFLFLALSMRHSVGNLHLNNNIIRQYRTRIVDLRLR